MLSHTRFFFFWFKQYRFHSGSCCVKFEARSPGPRSLFVGWCFEPSQPLGVTSGLNTNSNLSLSYSAHKSFDINQAPCMQHDMNTYVHQSTGGPPCKVYDHRQSHWIISVLRLRLTVLSMMVQGTHLLDSYSTGFTSVKCCL